ncbi:TRIM3 [Branchiostoma lanceolatum]|uniref:TRIM3 protein n=1 Tax=Branchiostoma lanceolatum TaxID=7740 RepID=A0A8K0ADG7_BRALA|nr:TRIM3 [Branchiostoma lanceolatum]
MYTGAALNSDQIRGQNTPNYNPVYLPNARNPNTTYILSPQPENRLLGTAGPNVPDTSSVTVGETAESVTVVAAQVVDEDYRRDGCNSSTNGADASADVTRNGLITNPMYLPRQAGIGYRHRRVCLGASAAILLAALIFGGISNEVLNCKMESATVAPPPESTTISSTNEYSFVTASTLPSVPTSSQESRDKNKNAEKIVFGGEGTDPGKFEENLGVAVSADNEIFVTDLFNRRVQVYNMTGVHLRLFPTVVPGENVTMVPFDVAIDGEGHLWVVVRKGHHDLSVHVVQYKKDGQPMTIFDVPDTTITWYPSIAVDVANNRIIVAGLRELFVFQPNGSFQRSFGTEQGLKTSYVTSDNEGRILVTDRSDQEVSKYGYSKSPLSSGVNVYDHRGHWLFNFGVIGGTGRLRMPRGICVDASGHIFVADEGRGSVDMFTSRGKFVHTAVRIAKPWAIAIGRDGQLVVTDPRANTVTIFPKQMVYQ